MKKTLLFAVLCCFFSMVFAGNVISVQDAKTVSKNFIAATNPTANVTLSDIVLQHTEYDENNEPVYYRFSIGENGFIIVSANDAVTPVLAYSLTDSFDESVSNYWTDRYKEDIVAAKSTVSAQAKREWETMMAYTPRRDGESTYVESEMLPLLTSKWNQTKYFNNHCPIQDAIQNQDGGDCDGKVAAGCVAAAMSMIMHYYRWPEYGMYGVDYRPVHYGENDTIYYPRQRQNFNTLHDYDMMPNEINNYTGEVAELLWHTGISVQMGYGPESSGAHSADAIDALKNNWKYERTAKMESRGNSTAVWTDSIVAELDRFRPIYYSAQRSDGGHAFCLDGYQKFNSVTPVEHYSNEIDHIDTLLTFYDYDLDSIFRIDTTIVDDVEVYDTVFAGFDTVATHITYLLDTVYTVDYITYDTAYSHTMVHVNWGWGGYHNGYYTIAGAGHLDGYTSSEAGFFGLYPAGDPEKAVSGHKTVYSARGSISDGPGHKFYQPNTDRTWTIAAPDAIRYKITFLKLMTEAGADEVIFYKNCNENDIAGRYSGYELPNTFYITADSIMVRFVTNGNDVVDRGFVFDYEVAFPASYCENETTLTGSGTFTDKGNQTFDEPTPYRPETTCTWKINSCAAAYFSYPQIELGAGDFIDFLEIRGNKRYLIKRIDAYNWPTEDVYYCPAHKIEVRFVSDNYVEGNGFTMTYEILTDIPENNDIDLTVYPNPASSTMFVDLSSENNGQLTLTITDMMGKVVSSEKLENNGGSLHHSINVSNLSKGMYILNVAGESGKTIRKFIVE